MPTHCPLPRSTSPLLPILTGSLPGLKERRWKDSTSNTVVTTFVTTEAAVQAFLADRQNRGLSPLTIQFYHSKLKQVSHRPLLFLTKPEVQSLLASLPCNAGGKHAYLRALSTFYGWAVDNGLITNNPCHKLTIKVPKPLRNTVQLASIPTLLSACDTVRDKLIVSLLADTGLRLSELAAIRLADVDLSLCVVRCWGKGAKQRIVRYGPATAAVLQTWLEERPDSPTLIGLKPRGISIMLQRLGERVGVKCNPHSLRRTFACQSVRNGMNLFYVQSLLGHSTLTMTRLYAEQVSSEDAIKAYKPIVT
jgi:site-specific recombinase XerD